MVLVTNTDGNLDLQPDDAVWLEALRDNERWLRRVLENRLHSPEEVDDVFQEIGVAISRRDRRPESPASYQSWLYRVAIRQVLQHRRKSGRYRNLQRRNQELTPTSHPSTADDPLITLMRTERQHSIRQAVNSLGELDREILMLKYVENWTYQQLADNLGVSKNTVEHRLVQAKRRLRKLLAQQAED